MISNDEIKLGWGAWGIIITFSAGEFLGNTYIWPAERLSDNRIWANTRKSIYQSEPEKREATDAEIEYIAIAVHQKSKTVIFSDEE